MMMMGKLCMHILLLHFYNYLHCLPSIFLIIFILGQFHFYIAGMNMIKHLGGKGITLVQQM